MTCEKPLSGTIGGVLDPIFALRTRLTLPAGAIQSMVFALAASYDANELRELSSAIDLERASTACDPQRRRPAGGNHCATRSDPIPRAAPQTPGTATYTPFRQQSGLTSLHTNGPQPDLFPNGYGGFWADGREYVIRVAPDAAGVAKLPPRPWSHIVANRRCGFIVTERGALCSWVDNSRENRLTPWSNDPVVDPCDELFLLREEASGVFWSPLTGPIDDGCTTNIRYGFGYAVYHKVCNELDHETTLYVPPDDPLRLVRFTIRNPTDRVRELELFTYHPWVLGNGSHCEMPGIMTQWDSVRSAILAERQDRKSRQQHCAFSAIAMDAQLDGVQYTGNGATFLGLSGDRSAPAAVCERGSLDGDVGRHRHPCAAIRVLLHIPANDSVTIWHLLGEAESTQAAQMLIDRYARREVAAQSLEESCAYWERLLAVLQVDTPSPVLNLMLNGWLVYQNIVCRLWGRSSYYQGGGAIGFRDQLQDACALRFHQPGWTRQQILLHAEHQFAAGDVLHWWHPEGPGLRTRFSDDLLWLPYAALEYIETTGDEDLWDVELPFCNGPELSLHEQERLMETEVAAERATLFDHCCRAFDRSRPVGAHGLPLIGCGDWNDGFSRVGAAGKGESVWLAMFLCYLLPRFSALCETRGDHQRAGEYAAWQSQLLAALEDQGWDGKWYRRAYLDNGEPLGSESNDECRIDALVQAWSILSGVATGERAAEIVRQVQAQLVDEDAGLIRLLTPAFDSESRDVGYIRGYVAGTRENGGQYTHGVLWFIRALAELKRGDDAIRLLEMITPISHTASAQRVETYGAEPYVVAADIYGEPPHTGRAGWTWYTGSAGWMYRVAIESMLGFQCREGKWLRLSPCLPQSWPGFRLSYSLPGDTTRYEIDVHRTDPTAGRSRGAWLDGQPIAVQDGAIQIPLVRDQRTHQVSYCL
jgi:cyclic beta-1,2-glucan synthetase